MCDGGGDVVGRLLGSVLAGRPLALPVPAQVKRDAASAVTQQISDDVERVRVQSAAVEKDHRGIGCGARPFEIVDAAAVRAGQHALGG